MQQLYFTASVVYGKVQLLVLPMIKDQYETQVFKMSTVRSLPQLGGSMNVKHLFLHRLRSLPVKMSAVHNVPVWNTTASSEQMHLNTGLLVKWIIHECSCHKAKGIWTRSEPGKIAASPGLCSRNIHLTVFAQNIRNGFWLTSMFDFKDLRNAQCQVT